MQGGWTAADVEPVDCFRCHRPGEPVWERPPFTVVRCPGCTQVFVSPRLTAAANQRLYGDPSYFEGRVYGEDDERFSLATKLQEVWSAGRLDLIERAVGGSAAGKRLLEIGCAYGLFLSAARDRGFEVVGFEYAAPAAARVRERLGFEVYAGEVEHSDLPPESFDVACFWDVIEHVADPLVFLTTVRRLVRPGGVVALSCPYVSSLPARLLRQRWWTLKPWEHIWHFTPGTLARVLEDAGLKVLAIRRSPLGQANLTRVDSLVALARAPAQQHAFATSRPLVEEPQQSAATGESASTV